MDLTQFSPASALLTIILVSLAPFVVVMITSFTKIVVVLGLLRNALGLQQSPPNVVINGMALILTMYVMYPVGLEMNERVGKVSDVLKEGDMVKVKVLAIDDRGKIKLSRRAVDQVTGEPLEVQPRPSRPPREGDGERGDRGERREGGFRRRRGGE